MEVNDERGASPQAENGHIDIANELGEALAKINLSPYESRILWVLWRKTYGWHRKTDRISITQFQEISKIDRRNLVRTLRRLEERKLIVVSRDNSRIVRYGFQKDYAKWRDIVSADDDAGKSRRCGQGKKKGIVSRDNRSLSPETPTKETNKRKYYVEGSDELRLALFF